MSEDWEDFDFGFSAVDADELGEIVSPSKTAEAVGKVEVQSNHVLERLDTIQTMLTLEVDARKKELEEKYQSENSQVFRDLEKISFKFEVIKFDIPSADLRTIFPV